ncbi:hypothetical protein M0R88_01355 [Halorussus gelatinilyticus]|uniref:Uncharacterized protein n=1 Tax=Halorussus gelatinilyticus TaxID=2937524 RepID=A0A8U0IKM2_9EURY|nr:hypothetical protein [Halorussus gelatinilyticus]UPW00764.1 hypothetical protein M0R88_01355 [Halorussus gelatinilyticus]
MQSEKLETWADTSDSELEGLLLSRFLEPPYGYVTGIVLWPAFFSLVSVWGVLLQSGLPSIVVTVGGLAVGIGGFVVTSMSSAFVMGATAWNTPYERIRRQSALLFPSLLLAALLFGLYLDWPTIPYGYELGLSAFVAHELSRIVLLGPSIGLAFVFFPLAVFVFRYRIKRKTGVES